MEINYHNQTDEIIFADNALLPLWITWLIIATIVILGLIFNSLLIWTIFRSSTYTPLGHIAFADIITLILLTPYEIITLTQNRLEWTFPVQYCSVFLGAEVITGAAVSYFLVVLNLTVATESGMHSLYPISLIWTLSVSLGLPNFIIASVVYPTPNLAVCTITNNMAFILYTFRAGLPIVLLIGSLIITWKYDEYSLPVGLDLTHILFSLSRSVLAMMYIFQNGEKTFYTPPLAFVTINAKLNFILSLLHYFLVTLRPVICLILSSKLRKAFIKNSDPLQDEVELTEIVN